MKLADETARKNVSSWVEQMRRGVGHERDPATTAIERAFEQWRKDRFVLALVGKAKRGKSTLVNVWLGCRDDALPIDQLSETLDLHVGAIGEPTGHTIFSRKACKRGSLYPRSSRCLMAISLWASFSLSLCFVGCSPSGVQPPGSQAVPQDGRVDPSTASKAILEVLQSDSGTFFQAGVLIKYAASGKENQRQMLENAGAVVEHFCNQENAQKAGNAAKAKSEGEEFSAACKRFREHLQNSTVGQ